MKIFWLEIKKESKAYVPNTPYSWVQWLLNVWKDLQSNLQTFYKMYRIDADIRRCIQEIQQTSWKWGWAVRKWIDNRKDYKNVEVKEVSDILWWNNFIRLKNEIIQQLSISWTLFIKKNINIEWKSNWFEVLDTRYMSVVTDWNLIPVRYIYQDKVQNQSIAYNPEDIYSYKDITDIDNPVFWISMLESIVYDVMWDLEASRSNYYFFQNDALPSSLYVLQEWLSAEAQEQIMTTLKTQLQWWHNKHKNIVSWNIIDIKPIARSHTDMDFLNQKKHKTEKVCATLWVPKIVLNYTDWVNYSNADIQYQKFIENTIRPTEWSLEVIFNDLFSDYLSWAEFYIIDKHINDFKDKLSLSIQAVQNWLITRNEARFFMWYDTIEADDMMNEYTVGSNTILLDAVASWTPIPTASEQISNNQ
jgi:hypothetical protein